MNTRAILGFSALAALAAPSIAQSSAAEAQPGLDQLLADFQANHGDGWRHLVDGGHGYLEFLGGGSMQGAFLPSSDEDFYALSRAALAETADLHGIEAGTLFEERVMLLPLAHVGTTDKYSVQYVQALNGVPVEAGYVTTLFNTDGDLLSFQSTAIPELQGLETTPAIEPGQAQRAAVAFFRGATGLPTNELSEATLVIHRTTGESEEPVLCWRVDTFWYGPESDPVGKTWFVDAQTGRMVRSAEAIHFYDVSGTVNTRVTPGTLPDSGLNPEVPAPAPSVSVSSSAGTVSTDANGNFTFVGPNSVNNVTVSYVGSWANVTNIAGGNFSLNAGTLSGSGNNIEMNSSPTAHTTAESNAYYYLSSMRDYVRTVVPADNSLDFQAPANVNIILNSDGTQANCNAYFNGSSTNYYTAGGGCVNTSYASVVYHEQGHWANVIYGTGNGSDGMGEGNADVWSTYQLDSPIVGENFCGPGCHVRNALTANTWCGPNCYGPSVHANGEVWMGTAWRIRRNFKVTYGNQMGVDLSNALFMAWMNGYNQTQILPIIETQWLTLDDDNGNIGDGSPNYADIDQAFREQNFPGVDLDFLTILNVTNLPDTLDEVGPYDVTADIDALISPPITVATLYYAVGSGPEQAVPMTFQGGSTWGGSIPGIPAPAVVEYHVEATDSNSNSEASAASVFMIGQVTEILNDNFSLDLGWTVTGSPDTGDWERANPQRTENGGLVAQPENDNPNGTGNMCFVTGPLAGSGWGSFDVDEGPTRILSPIFDMSGQDGVISFAYWFFNNDLDGDSLVVAISNNGGSSYSNVRTYVEMQGGWQQDSFIVSQYVVPTDQMRLRIVTSDSPNDSITEACFDDVVVRAVSTTNPCTPSNYCTAVANSSGMPADITSSGSTSVANNDLELVLFNAPASQSVVPIVSPDIDETPLGNGNLCLGSTTFGFIVRLAPGTIDGLGTYTHSIDVNSMPAPINQFLAGETWRFQFWFRDVPGGGAFFNFSNGLEVTFCP